VNQRIKALFFIARCLANDNRPESIASLRTELRSGQLSWEAVVNLANNQLVTPAVWVAIKRKGLTEELPGDLRYYLDELHQLNVERNAHLQAQLLEAVQKLNSVNVSPVLLKGAMHLVTDMYGDPGARIMSDIDLLVPENEIKKCMAALQELGYRIREEKLDDYPEHHHHCPPLFRPGDYADIEIHRKLMEGYADILSAETAIAHADTLVTQGIPLRVLSPSHRTIHNILHSQLVDRNHLAGILSLRSLHEMVTESVAYYDKLNWSLIHSLMERRNRGDVLRAYLYQAHRLLNFTLPEDIRTTPGCWLYYWRCIAEIGWQKIEAMGRRMQRYSADNVCRIYGCNDGWVAVNIARMKLAKRRITNYFSEARQR
jgi:hypothetical protein